VTRLLLAPLVAAAVMLPVVTGPLPGKRVPVSQAARRAGAVEVRQVAQAGPVPLLVGRTADRRLCVGSGSFFRCLAPIDSQPAYVIAAFGGHKEALVGLAGPETAKVVAELQDGAWEAIPLLKVPGFAWRTFALPPTGPNLPITVHIGATGGGEVPVDMGYARRPNGPSVGDSIDAPIGETRPQMEQAKRLALADPRVRAILGRATRLVRAPGRWTSCGRKFIGAITDVALVRPVHVDADLPVVSFGKEKRGRAYAEGTVHLTADDVTELHIGVDLNRGRVVSIDLGGDSVHTSGYSVVEPLTPAGAPDKATCPQGD
jgi:hypothetical protein